MGIHKPTNQEARVNQLMLDAIVDYSTTGWDQREQRVPERLSHSMIGKCHRAAVMRLCSHAGEGPGPKSRRVLELGTELHDRFSAALRFYQRDKGGMLLVLPPFRVNTWGDGVEAGVSGTPDDIIIDLENDFLYVVDHKTAKESSFRKKLSDSKFGGASENNLMQVAAYAYSEEIQALARALNLMVLPFITYWRKDDLTPFTFKATKKYERDAERWVIAQHVISQVFLQQDTLPAEISPPWMCAYCDLFPPLPDVIYPTIKAEKEVRVAHGERNCIRCGGCKTGQQLQEVIDSEWVQYASGRESE